MVSGRWFLPGKGKRRIQAAERQPVLEIQIHPGDIRSRVRYFFVDRRQIFWSIVGALAFVGFLLVNALIFPRVTGELLGRKEYEALVHERARQGERLEALIGGLEELGEESAELHLTMSRIYLAYGLENDSSVGQGGFPFESRSIPDSIYATAIRQGAGMESRIREQMEVLGTFIDEVQSFESGHGDQVQTTPSIAPLKGADNFVLTSPFGNRRSPFTKKADFHAGIDLAAPEGTVIYAPAAGQVVFSGRYPLRQSVSWWRYGNLVALRHSDRFITLFGHCSEILVRQGQQVEQGEVIAKVGNTGWSTSPHLHYEVRSRSEKGFEPVDPRIYILDHRWRDAETLLVRHRVAPEQRNFEPLPRIIGR